MRLSFAAIACFGFACLVVVACSRGGGATSESFETNIEGLRTDAGPATFDLIDPVVTVSPRVIPGGTLLVSITGKNGGNVRWPSTLVNDRENS